MGENLQMLLTFHAGGRFDVPFTSLARAGVVDGETHLGVVILQRAFQLAESGKCASVDDIQKQLKAEGVFEAGALDGTALRRQLREKCDLARGKEIRVRAVAAAPRKARRTRPSIL